MKFVIVIFGATGNLASLKLIPAIKEFAESVPQHTIELVGYSRSEISQTQQENLKDLDNLHATFLQGSYNNLNSLNTLLDSLTPDKSLLYIALPPSAYEEVIQALPISPQNTTLLIEKPFAQDSRAFLHITNALSTSGLANSTYFLDHYALKPALVLTPTILVDLSQVTGITVRALETVGIEGRLSYYATTGAVQDMFTHLYTLIKRTVTHFQSNLLDFIPHSIQLAQYAEVVNLLPPNTPTYFKLSGEAVFRHHRVNTVLESGKNLTEKITDITYHGPELRWENAPLSQLVENKQTHKSNESSSDHARLFTSILLGDSSDFLYTIKEAKEIVAIEERVLNLASSVSQPYTTYSN